MKFSRIYITVVLLLLSNISFTVEYPVPNYPYDITASDIDCDGDMDIIVGSHGSFEELQDTLTVMRNTGEGNFIQEKYDFSTHHFLKSATMNNDIYPDLITRSFDNENQVTIITNDGYGNFTDYSYIYDGHNIKISDTNNDGDNDIVFCKVNLNGYWGILHNNGYGEFTEEVYFETESNIMHLDTGKINEDEYSDIVLTTGDSIPPRIFYNIGFGFEVDTLMMRNYAQCFVKDMNNDTANDILFSTPGDFVGIPCDFMIGYNIGNEEFIYGDTLELPPLSSILNIADYNNDNYPDIVYHSVIFDSLEQPDEENIFFGFNNQDGTFSEPDMYYIGPCMFGFKLTSADLDNNGYNDIAFTSRDLHHVKILFNDGTGNFMEEPQVEISNEELIISTCKLSNYPNPFNPITTINYSLPVNVADPVIEIFNIKGQRIKTFNCQNQIPIIWDGTDKYQNQVSSGIYLYRIKSDEGVLISNKMLLLK